MLRYLKEQAVISICIPVYKDIEHLRRLLESISAQTYKYFEVVISDDTTNDSIGEFLSNYSFPGKIRYVHNPVSLGTPENWNESMRQASGEWIKLMHNDDWFTDENALQRFADAARRHPDCLFFYSAFQNIEEGTDRIQKVRCNFFDRLFLRFSPLHLFKRVYIGNPSCTMVHRSVALEYDKRFKFVVDFEYYIRVIRQYKKIRYLPAILLNIGFHPEQVTKYTFEVPAVQIPENLTLLQTMGLHILRNPFVYDYYWRLFRNMKIRTEQQIKEHWKSDIPPAITSMLQFQSKFSDSILSNGFFSKLLMAMKYAVFLFTGR